MNTFPAASDCNASTALQILCFFLKKCNFSLIFIPTVPKQSITICIFALLWAWTVKRVKSFANAYYVRLSLSLDFN